MNDQIRRVGLDGTGGSRRADYMREVCTLDKWMLVMRRRLDSRTYKSQRRYGCEVWSTSVTDRQSTGFIHIQTVNARHLLKGTTEDADTAYTTSMDTHPILDSRGGSPDWPLCKEPFNGGISCFSCSKILPGIGILSGCPSRPRSRIEA